MTNTITKSNVEVTYESITDDSNRFLTPEQFSSGLKNLGDDESLVVNLDYKRHSTSITVEINVINLGFNYEILESKIVDNKAASFKLNRKVFSSYDSLATYIISTYKNHIFISYYHYLESKYGNTVLPVLLNKLSEKEHLHGEVYDYYIADIDSPYEIERYKACHQKAMDSVEDGLSYASNVITFEGKKYRVGYSYTNY